MASFPERPPTHRASLTIQNLMWRHDRRDECFVASWAPASGSCASTRMSSSGVAGSKMKIMGLTQIKKSNLNKKAWSVVPWKCRYQMVHLIMECEREFTFFYNQDNTKFQFSIKKIGEIMSILHKLHRYSYSYPLSTCPIVPKLAGPSKLYNKHY